MYDLLHTVYIRFITINGRRGRANCDFIIDFSLLWLSAITPVIYWKVVSHRSVQTCSICSLSTRFCVVQNDRFCAPTHSAMRRTEFLMVRKRARGLRTDFRHFSGFIPELEAVSAIACRPCNLTNAEG